MKDKIALQPVINPSEYDVGVIVARFQVHKLHKGQKEMINFVINHHKKVIVFLGISRAEDSPDNSLDFATRKAMLQVEYPNLIILPILDQRYNSVWSNILDEQIGMPFGQKKTLLYGSRDSFLACYTGKHATTELTSTIDMSGTQIRLEVSKEILVSEKFRAGVIHSMYSKRARAYPTVDICPYNDKGQILLAKKPNEPNWRFFGGFVNPTDDNLEMAARREFGEESNGCHINNLKYIQSSRIDDWRLKNEKSKIMTTLFLGKFGFGQAKGTDDVAKVKWFDVSYFTKLNRIENEVMEEHQELLSNLITKIYEDKLVPNLGEFHKERVEPIDPDVVVVDEIYKVK
jgi:bifunctional NMN adenylyltransferase/nudix hydrolase